MKDSGLDLKWKRKPKKSQSQRKSWKVQDIFTEEMMKKK